MKEERSKSYFQLSPIPLYCSVVFKVICNVPNRLNVELFPEFFNHQRVVHAAIVKKQVQFLVTHSSGTAQTLQEVNELFSVKAVVFYLVGQQLMTSTNCSADCLTRLVSCAIMDMDILMRFRPSLHLETTSCKYGFITKDKMSTTGNDCFYSVVE